MTLAIHLVAVPLVFLAGLYAGYKLKEKLK